VPFFTLILSKRMAKRNLLYFLLLLSFQAAAQNFGGFPPSTKWQQLHTDTARIIFTGKARAQANRIANIIHQMAANTALGSRLKKINIVLHQNTLQANGYVGLAPFRSEYYLVPASNLFEFGNLPWNEMLAIHEYRHVQQYNNFNNGLTKLFRVIAGDGGQALANSLTIPDWFFEGDAVYAETAFTQMGRGRRPLFLSAYHSLWQAGKNYSWQKLRNGSYKDLVPSHYQTGFLLVNYGYQQYGSHFWKNVTQNASAFRGLFYPFQKGIKTFSGKDFKTFRKEAFEFYQKEIKTFDTIVTPKTVTNYYFPKAAGTDSIIYQKESYRTIPAFYVLTSNGERKIAQKSISTDNWLSYHNGKIAYTVFATHPRWSLTDFSDIVVLDINSKREKRLTNKGRYFTPQFSPNGNTILSVFINDEIETELHLLNSSNGEVIKKIRPRDGSYFVHPQFVNADNVVTGIRSNDGQMSMQLLNLLDGNATALIAAGNHTLGNFSVRNDTVYFTASFNGNDDIYAFDLKEKSLHQLTAAQTGMYFPQVQGDTLLFSNYTAHGMQLFKRDLRRLLWQPQPTTQIGAQVINYKIAATGEQILPAEDRTFNATPYKKSTGLINLHSWDPGLSLYSNNILNTLTTELYYRYNESEKSHTGGWSASYGGWFPVINGGVEYIANRHVEQPTRILTLDDLEARIGYNIPLNFTKGKTLKGLNFGSNLFFDRTVPTGETKNIIAAQSGSYLHHFASWAQQLPSARQHIFPKLGYSIATAYRHRLNASGYQTNGSTALYLPSFARNHSVVFTGSFQQVDTGALTFSNRFSLARGYDDFYYSRMWNVGANYHMPLLYPDWGIASIIYFMRIRSNFYFDYSTVYSRDKTASAALRSTGAEIYFDTKWWNQLPVTFGVRYSYLIDANFARGNRNRFELIVPVNLIPF